jgi:peptide deformylase
VAYFGGDSGGTHNKAGEVERASTSQLTNMAKRQGIDASWKKQKRKYSGWVAHIIQHGCGYLEGIII